MRSFSSLVASRPRRAATRCLAACALLTCATPVASVQAEVFATYRGGEVTRADVTGWKAFQGLDPQAPVRPSHVRAVALLEVYERLAGEADPLTTSRGRRLARAHQRRLATEALQELWSDRVRPGDDELRAYYDDHPDEFERPRRWRLTNVFLAADDETSRAEARQRLLDLRRQALAGADFGALAEQHSDSETAVRQGKMGWVYEDRLHPDVRHGLSGLEAGELSAPIDTERGVTLLRVEEVTPPGHLAFETIRARLAARLFRQHYRELRFANEDRLLAEAEPVEISAAGENPSMTFTDRGVRSTLTGEDLAVFLEISGERTSTPPEDEQWHRLLLAELLAGEAQRLGLTESAEFVNRLYWFRRHLRAALWVEANLVTPPLEEDALRRHFEADPEAFVTPEAWRFELLEISLRGDAVADRVRRAEAWAAGRPHQPLAFADAARAIDPSGESARVRHLGWLDEKDLFHLGFRLQPLAEELAVGERTPLVQQGPYLLMLEKQDHRPEHRPTFEEARERVARSLAAARRKTLLRQLEDRILAEHDYRLEAALAGA